MMMVGAFLFSRNEKYMTILEAEILSLLIASFATFGACILWLAQIREQAKKNCYNVKKLKQKIADDISPTIARQAREYQEALATTERVVRAIEYRINGIEQHLRLNNDYEPVDVSSHFDDVES